MKKILVLSFSLYSMLVFGQSNDAQKADYKQTISYLASDALAGRLTGTEGEKKSADFIKSQFISAGLQAAATDTGFFQTFEYTYLRLATPKNRLHVFGKNGPNMPALNKDFFLISQTCDTCKANGLVFDAGYGISYEKAGYNDYKNCTKADSGKIFIIKLGHPEKNNPHSAFGLINNLNSKINLALKYGASGIIFTNPDSFENAPNGILDRKIAPLHIPIFYFPNLKENASTIIAADMDCEVNHLKKYGTNVAAQVFRKNNKKYIVIGAHHDHIGMGEMGNSRSKDPFVHNGADDNASGVAMMLHMAKTLPNNKKFKKYNLLFVAFSGEELGLLGSKYFVNNCGIDTSKILCMINFDMVGRLNPENKTMVINGTGTSTYWNKRILKIKPDTNQLKITTTEGGIGASDHTSFYLANIPAIHIFSGQHREYHMPEDDEALINYDGMALIENYTVQLINKYPKKKRKFRTTKSSTNTQSTFKVTLGVMPDYTFNGAGMRLDNISAGKLADKAGLLRNDIITQLGNYAIGNVEDYMHALSHFNKGDETTIIFTRDNKQITKNIVFE